MNKRHRTPTIRTPRAKGGTLYVFPSSTEDIGLNLNERRNKVTLSHYALLNIPKAEDISYDPSSKKLSGENRFNLLNIPGHYDRVMNDGLYKKPGYLLAASLQNYAFNFETVLRNQSSYDYSNPVTVSERVFWKWLKETGAIRWVYNKKTNTFTEAPEIEHKPDLGDVRTGYKRVVQCIGEIKSGSNTYDTFGVFNETYVNIPSSYGGSVQYFKQYIDDNYSLGTIYGATNAESPDVLEGFSKDESTDSRVGSSILTDCYPYGDITTTKTSNKKFSIFPPTNIGTDTAPKYKEVPFPWWKSGKTDDDSKDTPRLGLYDNAEVTKLAYLTDPYLDYANVSESNQSLTDTIYYTKSQPDNSVTYYQSSRSRVDSLSLVTNINELRHIYHQQDPENKQLDDNLQLTYDNIAIDKADKIEFEFNTVLIYYSIFDQSGQNVIATNLFGVLFLEAPVDDLPSGLQTAGLAKFHLPTYKKVKSGSDGFGTSYSLRVNIKTFDVYDNTDAVINDQTTNSALQEENFNSVLHKLNRSIDLLKTSISVNSFIKSKYAELDLKSDKILQDNIELKKAYDNIIHNRTSFIKTKHLQAEDLIIDEIKSRKPMQGENKQSIIKFTVPSIESETFKNKYLRKLTDEEQKYIDAARKDLEVSPNQAASYRFDSYESAGKDFYQKLEYKGNLLDTKDTNILKLVNSLNEPASEGTTTTTDKTKDSTSAIDANAGADSYILDLIKRQIVVKFAKSVNIPDTTVDSDIELNNQAYKHISAYVNHITPELVIAPDSPAFRTAGDKDNTTDGILSHLLKFSTKDSNGEGAVNTAEINYVKLIPYIIKVLQMIDPKYFITESVLTVKSEQVPTIKADQLNKVELDSDGTIADKNTKGTADVDNLSRLSFNLTVQRGGLEINCYEPVLSEDDTKNLDALIIYLNKKVGINVTGKSKDELWVLLDPKLSNNYSTAYWHFLNLVYQAKRYIASKSTNSNAVSLDPELLAEDGSIKPSYTSLIEKLASLAWFWDFDDPNLHLLLSKNPDGAAASLSKEIIELTLSGPSDPILGTSKSIFDNQLCLRRTVKMFNDTESDLVSSYSWRPYIETYRASTNNKERAAFVVFKLKTNSFGTSNDGGAQTMESNKDIRFLITQNPNITVDPKTVDPKPAGSDPSASSTEVTTPNSETTASKQSGTESSDSSDSSTTGSTIAMSLSSPSGLASRETMHYNKEGTKIKKDTSSNDADMGSPVLEIGASGIIKENVGDNKKQHVIHVSHSNITSDGPTEDVKFDVNFDEKGDASISDTAEQGRLKN